MIETTTTCTITCDKCGKTIAAGERWFETRYAVTSSVFNGQAVDLVQVAETTAQLCETDYELASSAIADVAPTAQVIAPAPRIEPVPEPPILAGR